jgi:hypothetical protein
VTETPPSLRRAVGHAVAVAATSGVALTLAMLVELQRVDTVFDVLGWITHIARWSLLLGIAVAVAAHRRPSRSPARAAVECAGLACAVEVLALALWIGADLARAEVAGGSAGLGRDPWGLALELVKSFFFAPTLLANLGLAVALFLASSRRGQRGEGLALSGPPAVGRLLSQLLLDGTLLGLGWTVTHVLTLSLLLPRAVRAADAWLERDPA